MLELEFLPKRLSMRAAVLGEHFLNSPHVKTFFHLRFADADR